MANDRRVLLYILGPLLLIFSSCNMRPDYDTPCVETGADWRFAPAEAKCYANTDWWKLFEDPVLDELIDTALENNNDLQLASARVKEFYEKYRTVFADFFPTVEADMSYSRLKASKNIDFFPPLPGVARYNNLYRAFANIIYELDLFGGVRNRVASAKAKYEALIEEKKSVIISLVSSLATAYVQMRQFDLQREIAIATYETRKTAWDIALLRYNAGLVSQLEVKQAESEAEAAQVQIKNFEKFTAIQENLISVLIGEAPRAIPKGKTLLALHKPVALPVGVPSDLISKRPDIRQAEFKLIAANAEVGVARAAFFPSVFLTGSDGFISTTFKRLFRESSNQFNFGAASLQAIFTGGRIVSQNRLADAVFEEAIFNYMQTVLNAFKEVEDALISHQKAKEKWDVQQKQVAALDEYVRLATLRYENGQNDYLTVVEAEKSLFQSQLSWANTEAELYLSIIELFKALGQGWEVTDEE